MPRVSQEIMENKREYENLCNTFSVFFDWVEEKVCFLLFTSLNLAVTRYFQLCKHHPGIYKELSIFADVLPGKDASPAHPFSGFVLNLNVVTRSHRDVKDYSICLVLVIGQHVGGELCLVEPGLVLRLQNGDAVIFPSGKITHFNLHYQGTRASIVLHSDRAGKAWADDRNSWIGHEYMS